MLNLVKSLRAALILTILSIADVRAASMIAGLTLAQAVWYPAIRQSRVRSRP